MDGNAYGNKCIKSGIKSKEKYGLYWIFVICVEICVVGAERGKVEDVQDLINMGNESVQAAVGFYWWRTGV